MEDFVGKSKQCIPCNLLKYTPPQIFFYENVSFKQILCRRLIQEALRCVSPKIRDQTSYTSIYFKSHHVFSSLTVYLLQVKKLLPDRT